MGVNSSTMASTWSSSGQVARTPAMERDGMNFVGASNVSAPDGITRAGLAHLADGRVWVTGGNAERDAEISGPDGRGLIPHQLAKGPKSFPQRATDVHESIRGRC